MGMSIKSVANKLNIVCWVGIVAFALGIAGEVLVGFPLYLCFVTGTIVMFLAQTHRLGVHMVLDSLPSDTAIIREVLSAQEDKPTA